MNEPNLITAAAAKAKGYAPITSACHVSDSRELQTLNNIAKNLKTPFDVVEGSAANGRRVWTLWAPATRKKGDSFREQSEGFAGRHIRTGKGDQRSAAWVADRRINRTK